ncbi:hypothetical protein CEXT_581601 [Caerostris extrusa]|uniref:Uncharacterized protein n=1 Tax=Caerostris extrusa TaxID=172846 RepID=A0AAV4XKW8_CAEEX|nr:hypothetical protein CEXT_581601 [Caerostris extrusa]
MLNIFNLYSNKQSSRIRFPDAKFANTADGPYRLSAVVSIDRTHPNTRPGPYEQRYLLGYLFHSTKRSSKRAAEASPLQFASEIQISVNHNPLRKEELSEGAGNSPPLVKGGTSTPDPPILFGKRNSTVNTEEAQRNKIWIFITSTHRGSTLGVHLLHLEGNASAFRIGCGGGIKNQQEMGTRYYDLFGSKLIYSRHKNLCQDTRRPLSAFCCGHRMDGTSGEEVTSFSGTQRARY